jgi:probable rRNA maturation factor
VRNLQHSTFPKGSWHLYIKAMNFYLINNTAWGLSESFVGWLLDCICKELPDHKKDLRRELGVVIADTAQMTDLNEKFRQKKGVTDVLSFSGDGEFLGDVVVCYDVLLEQAQEHDLHVSEEFAYLLLHGVLHLLGYEHETNEADALKMFAIQDKIFEILMDLNISKAFEKNGKTSGS